jgi:hypothetical protein
LGHSELYCQNPGTRDANGNLPFDASLRAPDERKKVGSNENSSREQFANQSSRRDARYSSTAAETGPEATSPQKKNDARKRKGDMQTKVYRKVELLKPPVHETTNDMQLVPFTSPLSGQTIVQNEGSPSDSSTNKKRKTPGNSQSSAEAAQQLCQSQ